MIARIGALVGVAVLLIAAAPHADGPTGEPRANAWAVRVVVAAAGGTLLDVADVAAQAGEAPSSSASPLAAGGQDPNRVTADRKNPDVKQVVHSYDDPTGSLSIEEGFAEAHATSTQSSARAGFGSGGGGGFALADQLFTYDQQAQMLGMWSDLNDAIFTPLNEQLDALTPALGALGLGLPRIHGIAPEGLIDVGKAQMVASSASTSSSPGFSSARADTSLGDLRLFGGFIEAHDIRSEAVSESVVGADTRTATATIGSLSIAGIDVVGDGDGLHVAGNDVVSRTAMQPALDLLLTQLETLGMTIRVADGRGTGDLREATALEVTYTGPQGVLSISVAHADASAASVGASFEPPPTTSDPQVGGPASVVDDVRPPSTGGDTVTPLAAPPPPAGVTAPPVEGAIFRRPGVPEARAFRTAMLMLLMGAVLAAFTVPMSMRRARGASALKGAFR